MRIVLATLLVVVVAACAHSPAAEPLAGRIWDPAARAFVSPEEALARIARADVVLLGETHDNPAHHAIQRRVLARLVADGRRPALGFEQIDADRQAAVDAAQAAHADAQALAQAAQVASGWNWALYAPIASIALDAGLPIVALNLARPTIRAVMKEGFASLGPGAGERLALAAVWTPERNAALHADIVEAHCGEMGSMVEALVGVQRARDAVMAERILDHAARGMVAILGRGHARRDLAVPLYLAERAPAKHVLAVGLVEIDPDLAGAADHAEAAAGRFDLVWFTPRFERADPCASLQRKR